MRRPTLVVFDIDGTLVDSRALILRAMREACAACGLEAPEYEAVRRGIGLSLREAVSEAMPGLEADRLDHLEAAYRRAYQAMVAEPGFIEPLFPGAAELVGGLSKAGVKLALATGKSRRGMERVVAAQGWDVVLTSRHCAEDGPGKPDPAMLAAAMRASSASPERTVMVGDTGHDVRMALACGAWAQGVAWGFHTAAELAEAGAHHIAISFEELGARLLD